MTIRSLLTAAAQARLTRDDGFRFCPNEACPVAYFNAETGQVFDRTDVRVPIFQKETDPARPVCYCFGHSVADVTADSTISDSIVEKCKQGLDRCALTNPQGSCCLANVRQVGEQAERARSSAATSPAAGEGYCAIRPAGDAGGEHPAVAATGSASWSTAAIASALISAIAASACCIGPLVLALLGIGGAGLLLELEPYRPIFSAFTVGLLGAGFYLAYRRPKIATAGDGCGCERPKTNRAGRLMLWVATVVAGIFLAFPYIASTLLG